MVSCCLTGDSASSGREVARALKESINDFNRSQNSLQLKPVASLNSSQSLFDTEGRKETTLDKFYALIDTFNLFLILGIVSSENLKYITQPEDPYPSDEDKRRKRGGDMPSPGGGFPNSKGIDDEDTIIFSCCSTSPNLALPNDNIFRMLPNDSKQARFLAQEMVNAGKKAIAVVYREDEWGTQFQEDTIRESKRLRGVGDEGDETVANSVGYIVNAADLAPTASALSGNLQALIASFSKDEVAVISFGFGRDTSKLYEAAFVRNDVLRQVRWFGVDIYPDVINSREARDFAQLPDVQLVTSLVKVDRSHSRFKSLNEKLRSPPNIQASPYAFAAYDSVQILGIALSGSRIDVEHQSDTNLDVLQAVLNIVAKHYNGLLGNGALDENGDLASSNYELWRIKDNNWARVESEEESSDTRSTVSIATPVTLLTGILAVMSLMH